jgi:hypothetical protein
MTLIGKQRDFITRLLPLYRSRKKSGLSQLFSRCMRIVVKDAFLRSNPMESVVFLESNAWFTQHRQQVLRSKWPRGWWSRDFGAVRPLDLKGVIVQPLSVLAACAVF